MEEEGLLSRDDRIEDGRVRKYYEATDTRASGSLSASKA
jgi:DNA-binding PadR family transcriptional regulator